MGHIQCIQVSSLVFSKNNKKNDVNYELMFSLLSICSHKFLYCHIMKSILSSGKHLYVLYIFEINV